MTGRRPGERAVDQTEGPRRYWGRRGPFTPRPTIGRIHRAGSIRFLALLTLISLAASACGTGPDGAIGSSGASTPLASAAPETDQPVETESFAPNLPGQSETDWGPIWNALPPSYPVPEGAEPAEADSGPVSGAYTVAQDVSTARQLADYYAAALDEAGFGGTGIDGPLEDGSIQVWSSSGYGCDSIVTILPRGQESLITVLFGALCRFE